MPAPGGGCRLDFQALFLVADYRQNRHVDFLKRRGLIDRHAGYPISISRCDG